MAGPGRPKLPEKQRRERQLVIRLTDEEMAQIQQAAQRKDLTTARWARRMLLRAATTRS